MIFLFLYWLPSLVGEDLAVMWLSPCPSATSRVMVKLEISACIVMRMQIIHSWANTTLRCCSLLLHPFIFPNDCLFYNLPSSSKKILKNFVMEILNITGSRWNSVMNSHHPASTCGWCCGSLDSFPSSYYLVIEISLVLFLKSSFSKLENQVHFNVKQ